MAADKPALPNLAQSLALAMVAASDAPLLLLDGDLTLIAASRSFCRAFDPGAGAGQSVFSLGAGEWDLPQLRVLLTGTISGTVAVDAYEIDLLTAGRDTRRLVIKAQKLDYGDPDAARILMTVSDVTEARIAAKIREDLLHEKAILLQEVQHRVANSLQIIASVLLQSARKVQSEETRTHLKDARNRVMSIATVQKQLAASRQGDVALKPYLDKLCQSLGASMIRDHEQQSIEVNVDGSTVGADISISLGLIVTELVINALKHAFPDGRAGKIMVGYQSQGRNWTLSVDDDGVGMPKDPSFAPAGLGTSIVEAIARQLKARVRVADRRPGAAISIIHNQVAAVASDGSPEAARAI